jgi:hypothetical protein
MTWQHDIVTYHRRRGRPWARLLSVGKPLPLPLPLPLATDSTRIMDGLAVLAAAAAHEAEAHRQTCLWGPGIVFDPVTMRFQPLDVESADIDQAWGYTTRSCDPKKAPSQRVARKVARSPFVYRDTRLRVRATLFRGASAQGSF